MRKRQEEEEKRAKQEAELKKRTMERKSSREGILSSVSKSLGLQNGSINGTTNGNHDKTDAKGEFDDLISALRTGDVFGEDMAKFKRSRKTRVSSGSPTRTRTSLHRETSRERTGRRS